jgi:hypothetical protein
MAKKSKITKLLTGIILTIIIVLATLFVVFIFTEKQTTYTTPEQPIIEQPTPIAPQEQRGTPTPKAPEIKPTTPGIPIELKPQETTFWVNQIQVPPYTTYEEGLNYIPIKQSQLKTFAGSIGPYQTDPTQQVKIILCAQLSTAMAAPACENVPIIFKENYVSFARGYQDDEFIGGMAAKDYTAYYEVYAGNKPIAISNKAVIRTVRD